MNNRSERCQHIGDKPVRAGPYQVLAGGTMYNFFDRWLSQPEGVVLVPLLERFPSAAYEAVVPLPLEDFGGVPGNWRTLLESDILPRLEAGDQLLAFCAGSHGRTGTFLASLIALLETPAETPDPIAAVRERHCVRAVETAAQAAGVFALRGESLPPQYEARLY